MSAGLLPFDVPAGSYSWIAPYYAQVFQEIANGGSPYESLMDILTEIGFRVQLWVLVALFALSILIILLGLALRLYQGRMFIVHRLDKTVLIPGGALFPVCALAYSALGLIVLVGAIEISNLRTPFPSWFQGTRAAWIGPLWTAVFFEVWACYAGWYIRRYGAHFRESTLKTIFAFSLPVIVLVIAWVPPTVLFVLGAQDFNAAIGVSRTVLDLLVKWNSTWTPEKGLELDNFASLFEQGDGLGKGLLGYSEKFRIGCLYVATLLVITLIAYLVGAALELSHLSKTIRRLKIEHNLGVQTRASKEQRSRLAQLSHSVLRRQSTVKVDLEEQLDDEYARGQGKGRRQWILMEWVRTNRILTTGCIAALLVAEIGLLFWKGFTKQGFEAPSSQFKAEILLAGWLNSLLMTLVSLLILFRSLDGSSPLVDRLRTYLPFVPFPPSLERRNGTSVGSISTNGGPPRHHFNSEKTVVSERPIFENKIIIEEEEEQEEAGRAQSSSSLDTPSSSDEGHNRRPSYSSRSSSRNVLRIPVPTLEISAPPEERRGSSLGSIEMEDDDSAVDKEVGK
ncbi:hypothetical protein JCM5353_008503 [Sporobolomyces roseus]